MKWKDLINSFIKKNASSSINVFVFLLMIFGITIIGFFVPVKAFSANENRNLAMKPTFSWGDLIEGKFTSDYENFITDQFILRDSWIRMKTNSERLLLKQDINSVYFGKDGYLIEKHAAEDVLEEQATKNYTRLTKFLKYYDKKLKDGRVSLMLIPTASEILTNKMPAFASGYDQEAFIAKVKKAVSDDILINVTDTLKEHDEEYIYYKTDHHWTTLGAYYAYQEWAVENGFTPLSKDSFNKVKVSNKFYGSLHSKVNVKVKPDSIYLYKIKKNMQYQVTYDLAKKSKSLYNMSHLDGKDKYSVFLDGNHAVVEIETNKKNGRKLLIIKDSFAHSFVPFAANHYEKTYMIDLRYFNMSVEQYMKENKITDVLVLYNVMNYVKDKNTSKLILQTK